MIFEKNKREEMNGSNQEGGIVSHKTLAWRLRRGNSVEWSKNGIMVYYSQISPNEGPPLGGGTDFLTNQNTGGTFCGGDSRE